MNRELYIWLCILVMALVSFLLRSLPITLIRKQIKSPFIRSVLFYLPYVTISVMTVPAIFQVSEDPLCGIIALIAAGSVAWFTSNLFLSAVVACLSVLAVSLIF